MSDTGDIERRLSEVSERVARMEERMETARAEYRSDLAELMKEIAKDNATMTERMATGRWWQTAILAAVIGVSVATIGVLSNLPALIAN